MTTNNEASVMPANKTIPGWFAHCSINLSNGQPDEVAARESMDRFLALLDSPYICRIDWDTTLVDFLAHAIRFAQTALGGSGEYTPLRIRGDVAMDSVVDELLGKVVRKSNPIESVLIDAIISSDSTLVKALSLARAARDKEVHEVIDAASMLTGSNTACRALAKFLCEYVECDLRYFAMFPNGVEAFLEGK